MLTIGVLSSDVDDRSVGSLLNSFFELSPSSMLEENYFCWGDAIPLWISSFY